MRWAENLADFVSWYTIQYTKGSADILLDAISQCPDFLTSLTTGTAMSNFLDKLRIEKDHNSWLGKYWSQEYN